MPNPTDPFVYARSDKTPIWRVFDETRFLEWLRTKELYFPRPQDWEDPFENILLKLNYKSAITHQVLKVDPLVDIFFGQCWTHKEEETDATWRIYAPNKGGVRVRVSVANFYKQLSLALGIVQADTSICRVDYFPADEIARHARLSMEMLSALSDPEQMLMLLASKRPEFEHEQEVRVLYRDNAKAFANTKGLKVHIDPMHFIEEIVYDPRADAATATAFFNEVNKYGLSCPLWQSKLYHFPNVDVPIYWYP